VSDVSETRCDRCSAILSPWEPADRCGCAGPLRPSHPEVLYAVAASVSGPLRVQDFVRLADSQYGHRIGQPSANVALGDRRFCWAGQGTYGLYRHGPLPGPRSLEPAARLVLTAAGRPMTMAAIDYCLKALKYRYNSASLRNAVSRSYTINYRWSDGLYDLPRGEDAERRLRRDTGVVPPRHRAAWESLRERLAHDVQDALNTRADRLHNLENPNRFGLNWSQSVDD
jgi:hypothetical protein